MQGIVYKITNIINGTVYVGQTTKTLKQRWTEHVYDSIGKRRRKNNSYLHLSIDKYGKENFIAEVLNLCVDKKSLDDVERFYIKMLNTVRPNGYNISLGGTGVMHGRRMSAEAREKISAGLIGHVGATFIHTEMARQKISKSLIGNKRSVGRKHSAETKEKMRLSHLGRKYKTKKSLCNT
jgi:group I intron endonuclease